MKKIILTALLFSGLGFGQDGTHNHHQEHGKKMEMNEHNHGVENTKFNKALIKYEGLHQAFFDNNLAKIKSNAKEVLEELKNIQNEKINKTLIYTKKKLGEISMSDDIKESKEAMNTVSQGMLVVLEKHAQNKDYARFYCPMVKKYWIQNKTKIKKVMNPYASSSMPHCGSIKQ